MNNNRSSFACDLSKGNNCFYAHQVLPNGRTEQIGYSTNFIHLAELESGAAPLDWLSSNEIPINDSNYEKARTIVCDFFQQAHTLFSEFEPQTKTKPSVGNCYVNGSRMGQIRGQLRGSTKVAFIGYNEKENNVCAFATLFDPEEFLKDEYIQIDEQIHAKLETLITDTIDKLKTTLYN